MSQKNPESDRVRGQQQRYVESRNEIGAIARLCCTAPPDRYFLLPNRGIANYRGAPQIK